MQKKIIQQKPVVRRKNKVYKIKAVHVASLEATIQQNLQAARIVSLTPTWKHLCKHLRTVLQVEYPTQSREAESLLTRLINFNSDDTEDSRRVSEA